MANIALCTDPSKGVNQSKKKKKSRWFYVKSLLCGVDKYDLKQKKIQKEDKPKTTNYKSTDGLIKSENSKVKSGENIKNCASASDNRKKDNKVCDVKISNHSQIEKKCFQISSKNKKANNSSAIKIPDDNNNRYEKKIKVSKKSHRQRKNNKSSHSKDSEKSSLKIDEKNLKNAFKSVDSVISKNDNNENKKARRKKNKRTNASSSDKITSEFNKNTSPKKVQQKLETRKKKLIVDEFEKLQLENKKFVIYDLRCPIGSRISSYHEDDEDCPRMSRSKRKGKKLPLKNKPCVFVRPSLDLNNNETVDAEEEDSKKDDSNDSGIIDSVNVDLSTETWSSKFTELIEGTFETSNKTTVDSVGEDSSINNKKNKLEKQLEFDSEAWQRFRIGIGAKILLKLGWIPGKGLGKNLQGILFPIEVTKRRHRKAL